MFQSIQSQNTGIPSSDIASPPVKPTPVPTTSTNNGLAQSPVISPEKKSGTEKAAVKLSITSHGLLIIGFLSVLILVANLLIAFRLKNQAIVLINLKKTFQTQELVSKAGLNQDNISQLGSLNNYFLTKEKVLSFINFLNEQTPNLENLNYSFLGEEPAVSGQKYLPMAISAVGSGEETKKLLEKIIGLREPIEITEFELLTDPKTKMTSLTTKLNIYVRDDFSF
jgi:hypothetical protein